MTNKTKTTNTPLVALLARFGVERTAAGALGPLAVLALAWVGVMRSGLPVGRGKALAPDRPQG